MSVIDLWVESRLPRESLEQLSLFNSAVRIRLAMIWMSTSLVFLVTIFSRIQNQHRKSASIWSCHMYITNYCSSSGHGNFGESFWPFHVVEPTSAGALVRSHPWTTWSLGSWWQRFQGWCGISSQSTHSTGGDPFMGSNVVTKWFRRQNDTPWKFNSSPLKNYHPKRKVVFWPSFFRGYVKLWGCKWYTGTCW